MSTTFKPVWTRPDIMALAKQAHDLRESLRRINEECSTSSRGLAHNVRDRLQAEIVAANQAMVICIRLIAP